LPNRGRAQRCEPEVAMQARGFAIAFSCLASIVSSSVAPAAQQDRAVVFILLDDWGKESSAHYGTVPGQQPQANTPNIDALAADGVSFDNFYTPSVCAPARASFLTGLTPYESGFGQNLPGTELDDRHRTIATVFQAAGYATGHFGKWHLFGPPGISADCHVNRLGFDRTEGQKGAGTGHFDWPRAVDCVEQDPHETTFSATSFTDAAISFVQQQDQAGKPFFVFLAYNTPHSPWEYPPHSLTAADPDPYPEGFAPDLGDNVERLEVFHAMVEATDTEIGRLVQELETLGIRDDTTIVVASDNGTPQSIVDDLFDSGKGKGSPFYIGTNVPMIVAGPDIPAQLRGTFSEAIAQMSDLFATFVELEQISTPYVPENSKSFAYALTGDPSPLGARTIAEASVFDSYGFDSANRVHRNAMAAELCYSVHEYPQRGIGLRQYDNCLDPRQEVDLSLSADPSAVAARNLLVPYLYPAVGATDCSDIIDNDADGLADALDSGCEGDVDLSESSFDPGCDNGFDDDLSGDADLLDPGCSSALDPFEGISACSDGIDNDADGGIDFDGGAAFTGGVPLGPPDPQCDSLEDEFEYVVNECNDLIDNDGHGGTDADDLACSYFVLGLGLGIEGAACDDGEDDDGDLLVDLDDPDCLGLPWRNTESGGTRSCGVGFEVAPIVLVALVRHRRRSR
jgi:arylsulfatase A-like enzyme